jgi:hypothetical protein
MVRALIVGVMLALVVSPAAAQTVTGRASVIDGDTIEIRGERFRLQGVDTPESAQMCDDAAGKDYACGRLHSHSPTRSARATLHVR